MFAEVTFGHGLEDDAQVVENSSDAEDDEHHGEDLTGCRQWSNLPESDGGDRGDRLVERLEEREAEDEVADGPQGGHYDEPDEGKHLRSLIEWVGIDRLLFSSDYPHWDYDDARFAFKTPLTEVERKKIFNSNARAVYGL